MNVMLTSCGLETERIEAAFCTLLPKAANQLRALFITAAANAPDAVEVLPKCLHDLLRCGVKQENITVCDLYEPVEGDYDLVYLCGGSTAQLLRRINERGFREKLNAHIQAGGVVLGVSAGSIVFAQNLPENLGLLECPLDVHCSEESQEKPGKYPRARREKIRLGDRQAILFYEDEMEIIE